MEVKVAKIRDVTPHPKTYLDFEWKCTKCDTVVQDVVVENILFQYKKRNLGPMVTKKKCSNCEALHSMELRL